MSKVKSIDTTTIENTDFEVRSLDTQCVNVSEMDKPWWSNLKYLVAGVFFGIVLVKSEVISWFRIQEMFKLQSFHMYGVIGVGVMVAAIAVFLIKKFKARSLEGETIEFSDKRFMKGQIYGGLIFGLGWAITGACPGPLFAQLGAGTGVIAITILSAIAGTWVYGRFRDSLPN